MTIMNGKSDKYMVIREKKKKKKKIRVAALAWSKRIVLPHRQGHGKNKKRKKKTVVLCEGVVKDKNKIMHIWQTMIFPVRRLCLALSTRINHRKNGAGLVKLQDDVQTCGYEDVQVMWEMLQKTETELVDNHHKRKQLPFWRLFVCSNSNHTKASSQSSNQT
ncbi:hypothetical protein MTR_2g105430 [Medicago truncatula]|uniref:Uncharacterized protein n=2 Tax=Medicago truncatula TaxID=3880 RepID=G7ZYZ0_MEDTR|nr:hypothetical protein MTR_2g105430 [Medicago truncatula]